MSTIRAAGARRRALAAGMAATALLAACSGNGDGAGTATPSNLAGTTSSQAPAGDSSSTETTGSATPTPEGSETATSSTTSSGTTTSPSDTVRWKDNAQVPHLFFHSLVIDAKKAFGDPESGRGYLDYMVTQDEFAKILQQIYDNDYVLVSPHQLATVRSDGSLKLTPLRLPRGKKPMVISIDDVSYYEYMDGDGFPTKLVVASDGRVVNSYTDADGKTVEGSYDVMPMIDDFVREHPDFSHEGARGVIALTGYNGVFGYRTSKREYAGENPNIDADIATATQVADALKKDGWEFASHSWGHINFTESSLGRIQWDNQMWQEEVAPIVGKTDLLIYPFGADISGLPGYAGAKFDYLKGQGFSFFFNVDGSTPAWGQVGKDYLRQARINIDGLSMKAALDGRPVLKEFFDVKSVIDPARPASIAGS